MSMLTPSWGGGAGAAPKKGFNPLANITGAKNTTAAAKPSGAVQRAGTEARATSAVPASAPVTDPNANPGTDPNSFGNFTTAPVDNTAPAMTDEDYLASDAMFQAQKNALQTALDAYLADSAAQRQTYETNYGDSLRKLGFTGDKGLLDKAKWDPTDQRFEVDNAPVQGFSWNETDNLTASGRGFENALNDFASRGMLQSSAYGRARNDLMRNLNEQLASTAGAKQTAMAEFARNEAAKKQEKQMSEAQAAQETLARVKAAYGIG